MSVRVISVSIVNSAGETPKDVARRFGRLACVNLLGGDTGTSWFYFVPLDQRFALQYSAWMYPKYNPI